MLDTMFTSLKHVRRYTILSTKEYNFIVESLEESVQHKIECGYTQDEIRNWLMGYLDCLVPLYAQDILSAKDYIEIREMIFDYYRNV